VRIPASAIVLAALAAATARAGPDTTAEYDALPYRDTFADLEPAPGDLTLAAHLALVETGRDVLHSLSDEDAVRVLRAGLRLPDDASAAWCATWLDADAMDLAERRAAADAIVADFVARPEARRSRLGNLLECFSGAQVRSMVERLSGVPPHLLAEGSFSYLHKVMRADAMPALADLLGPLDGDVPVGLEEVAWIHAWHTDRHRASMARVRLGDERSAGLPADGPGVPPVLRACLDEIMAHPEGPAESTYWTWAARWLRDVTPVETDVPWLESLAQEDVAVAAWSLHRLDGEESLAALRRIVDDASAWDAGTAARAALAARGDVPALAALREEAGDDGLALALLLEVEPELGARDLLDRILAADGEEDEYGEPLVEDVVDTLDEALWVERLTYRLAWEPAVFAGFEERLLASKASADLLHAVARFVPGCGTRRMAAEVLARGGGAPLRVIASSFLEHGAPDAYRVRLRQWAQSDDEEVREAALWTLLTIGDPDAGEMLVAVLSEPPLSEDASLALLARSPCDAVREHLRGVVERSEGTDDWDAVVALARLAGLPDGVELASWRTDPASGDSEDLPADDLAAIRAFVLDGRPVEAFVRQLEVSPDDLRERAGEVRESRVTAYLRRIQERRHLEAYSWATAELAIQGHEDARAETWQALRRRSYRWCDDLDTRQSTMGFDLGTMPHWADFFESSCCQFPTARVVWDHVFGIEPEHSNGLGYTGQDWAHRWWSEHPAPFAWSHLAEHFVPVPR
jgi:hypothetical protein